MSMAPRRRRGRVHGRRRHRESDPPRRFDGGWLPAPRSPARPERCASRPGRVTRDGGLREPRIPARVRRDYAEGAVLSIDRDHVVQLGDADVPTLISWGSRTSSSRAKDRYGSRRRSPVPRSRCTSRPATRCTGSVPKGSSGIWSRALRTHVSASPSAQACRASRRTLCGKERYP